MEELTKLVSNINSFIWGMYCLIPLLCGVGIYFTIRLKFIQVRKFGQAVRMLFGDLSLKGKRADKHGMSSFQSVATAIAAQVGTGNLAGAATAIAMGGPGAIFWMWIAAFFRRPRLLHFQRSRQPQAGRVLLGLHHHRPGLHRQHGAVQLHRRRLQDRF